MTPQEMYAKVTECVEWCGRIQNNFDDQFVAQAQKFSDLIETLADAIEKLEQEKGDLELALATLAVQQDDLAQRLAAIENLING